MKKILSSLLITLLISGQALAETPALPLYQEPDIDMEFMFENNDNSIANLINAFIDTSLVSEDFNEKETQIISLFREELAGETILLQAQNSGAVLVSEQTSVEFNDFLQEIEEIISLRTETSGFMSYEIRFGDLAFANFNDKLVISDSNETIFALSEEVPSEDLVLEGQSILSIEGTYDSSEFDYLVSENPDGTLISSAETQFDSSINTDGFNTNQHLYNDLPSNNAFFYIEANKILDMVVSFLPETERNEVLEELDFELSQDLPNYETLLNKQTAFLVDLNDTILPHLTLAMADISVSEAEQLNGFFGPMLSAELESSDFTTQTTEVNANLTQVVYTATETNAEADLLDIDSITVTYGLHEGNYILSNNPTILTAQETLGQDSTFSNSVAASKANVTTVSFIDFNTLANQVDVYAAAYKKIAEPIETETQESLDTIENILNEMEAWSGYGYFEGNTYLEKGEVKIPSQEIQTLLNELPKSDLYQDNYIYTPYDDVASGSWYEEAVSQAYYDGIVDAYDPIREEYTYEFQPGQDITRGEFVDMIVRAYDLQYEDIDQYGSEIFSDVDSVSYYDYSIGIAYQFGLVRGDDGANTFRPNDTLNRAEAVQILYNASPLLNGKTSSTNNFKDVPNGAWYQNIVSVAVQEKIVEGINPEEFAPAKNLNKAEAITLVIRLVNNEVRF